MIDAKEQPVYDVLGELEIPVERHEHPPVFTVEEAIRHWAGIDAAHCKNLFLRNKKGTIHYLVILEHTSRWTSAASSNGWVTTASASRRPSG